MQSAGSRVHADHVIDPHERCKGLFECLDLLAEDKLGCVHDPIEGSLELGP
jgi:hypothetical protein